MFEAEAQANLKGRRDAPVDLDLASVDLRLSTVQLQIKPHGKATCCCRFFQSMWKAAAEITMPD